MKTCPLFEKCGGCKFDFTSENYRDKKLELLKRLPLCENPIWIASGGRRRAEFAFLNSEFGFFAAGSKNIIRVENCPLLTPELNKILPFISALPFPGGGSVLITECDNGIDVSVVSGVSYFSTEFKKAAQKIPALRISWNNQILKCIATPRIKFGDIIIDYPQNAFLQPTVPGEIILRELVISAATGSKKIADLFCGLGNFTFGLNADGFDIIGDAPRDLFKKPLTVQNLRKYDCVVMDPPRAGAMAQCVEIARSIVPRVIYVSCNLDTFMRDMAILTRGGFVLDSITPIDQFVGAGHWEIVAVFNK